jgi:nucleoside-diphosphate-sugar epimerase
MKRILIIGGCGYIGSKLFTHFGSKLKYQIDTVDLEWFGNTVNPNNFILDYRNLTKEFVQKYDVVILLAGHSSTAMALNSTNNSAIKNNLDNFTNLLLKIGKHQKFIYASSSSVYNGILDSEVTEDHVLLAPQNVYDFTKKGIDEVMVLFPDIEFYALRFATVNGASDNLREDIMFNMMIKSAVLDNTVNVLNPYLRRPILHMTDLVNAIEIIVESATDKRGFYNMSSFNGTVEEYANIVSDLTSAKIHISTEAEFSTMLGGKLGIPLDFSINSDKFESTFNYKFAGTPESITQDVSNIIEVVKKSKRSQGKEYE